MTEKLTIRRATLEDLPHIEKICIKTGASGQDASGLLRNEKLLSLIYAEPYLHFDLSICFVACSNDDVVGYILGALNTIKFNQWMNSTWLPALQSIYCAEENDSALEVSLMARLQLGLETPPVVDLYPSHLHIDLLPCAQGHGAGRQLMVTLFDQLIKQGSKGVHLGVGIQNKRAIDFYRHLGFRILLEHPTGLTLGVAFPDTKAI